MQPVQLAHFSVRTPNLAASQRFYTDVLGLRVGFRPPFDFPGVWLYAGGGDTGCGVVHLIGIEPGSEGNLRGYLGNRSTSHGSGAIDHIAFSAEDWPKVRHRFDALRVGYTQRSAPDISLMQVFLIDPSGVTIELNFQVTCAAAEPNGSDGLLAHPHPLASHGTGK